MARGDTHPNAGVLLMTKELQESGSVIRVLHDCRIVCFTDDLCLMSSKAVVRIHHGKYGSRICKLSKAYTKGMQESPLHIQ